MDNSTSTSLKENCSKRISDMISDIKSCNTKESLIILIVDEYTIKIISSIMTMSELLALGIFSIEKLELEREPFPKFKGLYFITPIEASIKCIEKDFANPKIPLYGKTYIFFSHPATETILQLLSKNSNFLRRLKLCKELNLSLHVKDDDLYDLGISNGLEIYVTKNEEIKTNFILSIIAEKIFTCCTVNNEFPFIQYNKASIYCTKVAEFVHAKISQFYSKKNNSFNEKRGILLILDRTIDITGPFLHDYYYECMLYDLFNIKDNVIELENKQFNLNNKDDLWKKYKNMHIAEVFNQIHIDYKAFMDSGVGKFQKENEIMDFDQMSKILHGIEGFKTQVNHFKLHLNIAEQITNVR